MYRTATTARAYGGHRSCSARDYRVKAHSHFWRRRYRAVFFGERLFACCGLPEPYFVIIRFGGAVGVGAAGEMTNVTHAFQPSGRFSAANSL